jgi:hypothetical protein
MLLDLDQQTTSRLGLEPIKNADGKYSFGGIVPTRVLSVGVVMQKHEKGEFAGREVPTLAIELGNFKLKADDPDRGYTHYIKVVGSKEKVEGTEDQYKDRDASKIVDDNTEMWKLIKHFIESLVGSPNYRSVATISSKDVEENFDLPLLGKADDRLLKYQKFFDYISAFINGDGNEIKSMIVDKAGEPLPMWAKLTPNYDKDPKRNKKYYNISRFIGQGVFEPMILVNGLPSSPKILKIKPTESLELIAGAVGNTANRSNNSGNDTVDPAVAALLS